MGGLSSAFEVADPWPRFDQGDLPYWAEKFASSARVEEDFIVVELGDEVGCSMAQ